MTAQYFPELATVRAVALGAKLRNPHPSARTWLLEKVDRPPSDWDERAVLTVPGVVWTVSSDTCATGGLSAPNNVAYDDGHREFVFRQPRDAAELGAVMSADSEEIFACYRFDGLERWTSQSVDAWHAVTAGWVVYVTRLQPESHGGNLRRTGRLLGRVPVGRCLSTIAISQADVVATPYFPDSATVLTVPGMVWTVSSDTCATGRLSAPDNVAYDHFHREFVIGYARRALAEADDPELQQCLGAYASYLESDEFRHYIGALRSHLDALGRTGPATICRESPSRGCVRRPGGDAAWAAPNRGRPIGAHAPARLAAGMASL